MSHEGVAAHQSTTNNNNEEDDYEDMVTPTDDEGIASLNHTQKIPISLIKAKDKASVSERNSSNHPLRVWSSLLFDNNLNLNISCCR